MPSTAPSFDPEELMTSLEDEFGGREAERRVVARQARDLADSGKVERDRGQPLTVEEVVRQMRDAPDDSTIPERWNWWLGSLEAAYGGYREFQVTRIPNGD
ncbi:hypothetical protein C499_10459 [Halogeometricum borinquense DSM 11551]|nr:hypothetical protein [Halogeometricum borinquense]ELY27479.1 hypothetical protein C499_10459 [Halogeometricum borinquense DSM 11551]RYJ19572.1 hypothetical protein ELS19_00845 [Halogeometricum borinquense]